MVDVGESKGQRLCVACVASVACVAAYASIARTDGLRTVIRVSRGVQAYFVSHAGALSPRVEPQRRSGEKNEMPDCLAYTWTHPARSP